MDGKKGKKKKKGKKLANRKTVVNSSSESESEGEIKSEPEEGNQHFDHFFCHKQVSWFLIMLMYKIHHM